MDVVEGMLAADDFIENFLKVGRPVLMKRATLSGPTGLGVLWTHTHTEREHTYTQHVNLTNGVQDVGSERTKEETGQPVCLGAIQARSPRGTAGGH